MLVDLFLLYLEQFCVFVLSDYTKIIFPNFEFQIPEYLRQYFEKIDTKFLIEITINHSRHA